MGQLSKHFKREEFACKCGKCGQDTVDWELLQVLERLRRHTGPITVTSGNRCYEHNLAIGGAPKSKHVFSIAADIQVEGWSPMSVYTLLDEWYPDRYGIGVYGGWVHIDVRPVKARWDKR